MKNPSEVDNFQTDFARQFHLAHAFAFWKGRVAMYAILKAMGIGEGDEIILPGYTCVMDVNPPKYLGAVPVYVDIDPVTYNARPELIEQAITPQTKLIIAQHTYGIPCDMDAIMDIANRHGLPVVEDCCLAMGSTYRGRLCGAFGLAAYWSFQWNKPFTTGIGGMATTDDAGLAAKIGELFERERIQPPRKAAAMLAVQRLVYRLFIYPRTTALATSLFRWLTKKGIVVGSSTTCEFEPTMAEDFFMGMSAGQARAGLRQLRKVDENMAHRRQMKRIYDDLLAQADMNVPSLPPEVDPVLVRYPVRLADKQRAVAEAPSAGVEIGTWFECPLHPIETPMHLYGYEKGMCPEAERASREVINLPTHPRTNERVAQRSVEFLSQLILPESSPS